MVQGAWCSRCVCCCALLSVRALSAHPLPCRAAVRHAFCSSHGRPHELYLFDLLQGHFQVLFDREHCPIFQSDLSWLQRIMYLQGVWSYIVGSLCTPTFIIVPIVTIWAGVFPIVLNFWAAVGLTIYYIATSMVRRLRPCPLLM
jgi:hypothetical protein